MGYEIRSVPADWVHPREMHGEKNHIPLLGRDYNEEAADWYRQAAQWQRGEHPHQLEGAEVKRGTYVHRALDCKWYHEWGPERPTSGKYHYMDYHIGDRPRTHFQYYETVSEGTPRSPVFATEQEAQQWMNDNNDGNDWDGPD